MEPGQEIADYIDKLIVKKVINMATIINDIINERLRQDKKWGVQHWPSLNQILMNREGGCTPERMCEHYEIPSEERAKFLCENAFKTGEGTWTNIIVEELSEAVCSENDELRRKELVQLAACVVAWIEDIDFKNKNK